MKLKFLYLILIFTVFFYSQSFSAENKIGVVKSSYDNVSLVLKNYNIPFKYIEYRELDNPQTYSKFDSIFFPSGISDKYGKNLDIHFRGKKIQSVKISDDFFELDLNKFKNLFNRFSDKGGAAYFSGYSFKLLNSVYDNMHFFYNFPYMGMPGRLESEIFGDLSNFSLKKKAALYMDYNGWITLEDVDNSQVLSRGTFMTPKGKKSGPLSFIMNHGSGDIIYTSYYSTVYSEFKRFNIMRIAGNKFLQTTIRTVQENFQKSLTKIVDVFLKNETSRLYLLKLKSGRNTIYLSSERSPFMYEIYSSSKALILASNKYDLHQSYKLDSLKDDFCVVKIYPSATNKSSIFTIVSANGSFLSLNTWNWKKILAIVLGFLFLIAFIKVLYDRMKV